MLVVLPLMGCGSQESLNGDDGSRRDSSFAQSGAVSRPSRSALGSSGSPHAYAASGEGIAKREVTQASVQTYGHVPASAAYAPGGIQRTGLAPLSGAGNAGGEGDGAPPGYAYAATLPPIHHEGANSAAAGEKSTDRHPALQREANNYDWQKRQQAYPAEQGDYQDAERGPRRGAYAPEARYPKSEPQQGGEYVVQPGDTLYAIARQHGISLDELSQSNGLSGGHIYPGQRLHVETPEPAHEGKPHREARPEPRPYRQPPEERGAPSPYNEQADEGPKPYRAAPKAQVYQQRGYEEAPPRQPRHDGGDRRAAPGAYDDARQTPGRVHEDPRAYNGRPEYTSSNRKHTPDGPFQPAPDAPWRGEKEWRRLNPGAERPQPYEPRPATGYERGPESGYEPGPAPRDAYDARGAYQPGPAGRAPHEPRAAYPATPRASGAGGFVHTVQRGETLTDIARRNGVGQRELAEFNGLPPGARLQAGQDLRIPKGQGYDWGGNRPEPAERPAPRPRASVQPERAQREVRPLAGEAVKAPSHRGVRAAEPLAPRPTERPAAQEVIEDDAPPARSAEAHDMPAARAAVATSDGSAIIAANDPTAAKAAPNAMSERGAARECETLLANPEQRSSKSFRMPVQGRVIAKFGAKEDGAFNDGINFSVPKGTPVKAAENGVVAYAGDELAGFGNLVLVRHADGYVTAYAHNDELLVEKCDVIKRGQIISKAGASGTAVSPQLHFELRKDSKPIDPEGHFSGT